MEKAKRGFALVDPARRKQIASLGGKKAHEMGVAHEFTTEQAKAAGRKGGLAPHPVKRGRKVIAA